MSSRPFAIALSLNRLAFGLRFVLQPAEAGRSWIGKRAARRSQTQVFARALGARDLALGLGALRALAQHDQAAARAWMAGHAISDGTDVVATLIAKDDLPRGAVLFALGMAGASTAIAVWSTASPPE
jgi:hypothetical protein